MISKCGLGVRSRSVIVVVSRTFPVHFRSDVSMDVMFWGYFRLYRTGCISGIKDCHFYAVSVLFGKKICLIYVVSLCQAFHFVIYVSISIFAKFGGQLDQLFYWLILEG